MTAFGGDVQQWLRRRAAIDATPRQSDVPDDTRKVSLLLTVEEVRRLWKELEVMRHFDLEDGDDYYESFRGLIGYAVTEIDKSADPDRRWSFYLEENAPDPEQLTDPRTQLYQELKQLKDDSGLKLRQIQARSNARGDGVSLGTLSSMFRPGILLPRWRYIRAAVLALGGDEDRFHRLWLAAYEQMRARQDEEDSASE
ncbi:hypothetical protein [Nocardia sp. NPDC004722]